MKYIRLYEHFNSLLSSVDKAEIIEILKKYEINNYTINDDGTVDVDDMVNLYDLDLKEIPVCFGVVSGDFDCGENQLASLHGCPTKVGGCFGCSNNMLSSLAEGPKEVGGDYFCKRNRLVTLKGSPEEIFGSFDCSENRLESLEGCPSEISRDLDCRNNYLTDLDITSNIEGTLYCNGNRINRYTYSFYGHCDNIDLWKSNSYY